LNIGKFTISSSFLPGMQILFHAAAENLAQIAMETTFCRVQ